MDREVAQKVDQVLKETVSLQKVGQELVGRDRLQQALSKAEIELKQLEISQPSQQTQASTTTEPRPSEVVKNVRTEVQQEPNLQKAVEKVRDQVVNNPKVDREVAQKVDQALKETISLQKAGQESVGRDRLQQSLSKAEVDLKQLESRQPAQQSQEANVKEAIQKVQNEIQTETDTKKIISKVQDAAANLKNTHPELTRNIERFANQANQLDQAARDRLTNMLRQAEAALTQTENTTKQNEGQSKVQEANPKLNVQAQPETTKAQQQTSVGQQESAQQPKTPEIKASETMKQALKIMGSEPNMEQALNKIQKEITSNPNIDLKTIDKVEKAIEGAQQLQDKGREMAARQQLTKELTDTQQELVKTEPKTSSEQQTMQNACTV